jgi:hypothetical protein
VKRSGRDEPVWVATHKSMKATLGISLYSYFYTKLAKTICLSYYLLCFLFNKIREGRTDSAWKQGYGGVGVLVGGLGGGGRMYTHVSKCINDKMKREKNLKI